MVKRELKSRVFKNGNPLVRSGRTEGQRLINVLLRLSLEATALFVTVFESIPKNLSFLTHVQNSYGKKLNVIFYKIFFR